MPTYQYACRSCDHRFEAVQGFHEEALRVCPECEAEGLRKLFGNVGVVFKGSGFYRTDSRQNGSSGKGGRPSGSDGGSSAGSSAKASSSDAAGGSGGSSAPSGPASASSGSSTKAPAAS